MLRIPLTLAPSSRTMSNLYFLVLGQNSQFACEYWSPVLHAEIASKLTHDHEDLCFHHIASPISAKQMVVINYKNYPCVLCGSLVISFYPCVLFPRPTILSLFILCLCSLRFLIRFIDYALRWL